MIKQLLIIVAALCGIALLATYYMLILPVLFAWLCWGAWRLSRAEKTAAPRSRSTHTGSGFPLQPLRHSGAAGT